MLSMKSQLNTKPKKNQKSEAANVIWRPTKFFRVNGYYSFEEGTDDSIGFLKNYTSSTSNEFILSNWRHIIDYKWDKVVVYLLPAAALHTCHVVAYSIFLLRPSVFWLLLLDAGILCVLIVYEASAMLVTGLSHFRDFYNLLDFGLISSSAVILALTRHIEYGL